MKRIAHLPGNTFSLMVTGLIVLVLIAVTSACSVSEEEAEQAEIDIAGAAIEVHVTASSLAEDYEANQVAANQKYDGKVLAVSGTVEAVSGGESGEAYYVDLNTGSFSLTSVSPNPPMDRDGRREDSGRG